jgi:monothiol glutaredoxin
MTSRWSVWTFRATSLGPGDYPCPESTDKRRIANMALNETLRTQISELVTRSRVVLFMKGTRQMPQCGFSAKVVQILEGLGTSYETIDVLRSPELRDGIKEFSQWPTIPQLYVDGQFVGGCDIVGEMNASGELRKIIGSKTAATTMPAVTVTDAATKAFESALAGAGDDFIRLEIDVDYRHALFVAPRVTGDVQVAANGLTLLLDEASARRADGVHIDFVSGDGGGFKITNPSEPRRVKSLSPKDVRSMFDRGEKFELLDVRTSQERGIAIIDGARHLDNAEEQRLAALDRNATLVFHCHHGGRSQRAAERALEQGFTNVYNLEGGIDAWSQTVDPSVPRY